MKKIVLVLMLLPCLLISEDYYLSVGSNNELGGAVAVEATGKLENVGLTLGFVGLRDATSSTTHQSYNLDVYEPYLLILGSLPIKDYIAGYLTAGSSFIIGIANRYIDYRPELVYGIGFNVYPYERIIIDIGYNNKTNLKLGIGYKF